MIVRNVRTRTVTLISLCRLLYSSALIICAITQDSTAASLTDDVSLWHFALSSALISVEHSSGICVLSKTLALVSLKLVNHLGPCNHRAPGEFYRIQSS